MKRYQLLAPFLGVALTLAADIAMCADDKLNVPHTAAAQTSAKLISRAERAINGFVAACAVRDARRLSDVTTSQVRVEYALDEPGTYLSMDASSLLAACAANNAGSRVSNLWIFPTNDANTVFVQYDAQSTETGSHGQLALVELKKGDRISQECSTSRRYPKRSWLAWFTGQRRRTMAGRPSTTTAARVIR